jgi:hypothetical protein
MSNPFYYNISYNNENKHIKELCEMVLNDTNFDINREEIISFFFRFIIQFKDLFNQKEYNKILDKIENIYEDNLYLLKIIVNENEEQLFFFSKLIRYIKIICFTELIKNSLISSNYNSMIIYFKILFQIGYSSNSLESSVLNDVLLTLFINKRYQDYIELIEFIRNFGSHSTYTWNINVFLEKLYSDIESNIITEMDCLNQIRDYIDHFNKTNIIYFVFNLPTKLLIINDSIENKKKRLNLISSICNSLKNNKNSLSILIQFSLNDEEMKLFINLVKENNNIINLKGTFFFIKRELILESYNYLEKNKQLQKPKKNVFIQLISILAKL